MGTMSSPNGEKHVGSSKMISFMEKVRTPGLTESYEGEYRNGKRHGDGELTFANGEKYTGEHKFGKRDGQGTHVIPNGIKYVGTYRDGKRNGEGVDWP